MSILLTLCNCPNNEVANLIAHALVQEQLAACVNILPEVRSVYRWQGAVETAGEVQLQIKSSMAVQSRLIERIQSLHPYELPEIISVEVGSGLAGYLDWVRGACHQSESDQG